MMALFNSVYTGGFSSYLSSNTLRNSPKHWSFGKADRFLPQIVDNCAKFTSLPPSLSIRHTNFGFGDRGFMKNLVGANSPPPTQYRVVSEFEKKEPLKGKTFGVARQCYQNVFVPGIDTMAPVNAAQVPGPGQYAHAETNPLGKNARKTTLKSRVPPSSTATRDFPGPNVYRPGFGLVEMARFSGIGFGVGNRGSPTGPPSTSVLHRG